MKHKISKPLRLLLLCMIGVAACIGVYFLFDVLWNGAFVDWAEKTYMVKESHFWPAQGQSEVIYRADWAKLKHHLLCLFIALSLGVIVVVFFVINACVEAEKKRTITEVSRFLRDYLTVDGGERPLPIAYAEIAVELSKVKTAMLQKEQALQNEASRKNDLVAYLAHDLKTPLTSVIGYLSLLVESQDMPEEQRAKFAHVALDKAYRLEGLVNEFFEITRFNLQEIKLQKENIDLYYMLVQMMDEFYPILSAKGNTATLQADESLTAYGDSVKLARVFNNILKNAAAYSTPNTEILIRAKQEEGRVIVSIQNHGPTIPAERLASIFEKFYRMDEARTSNTGGAGLGLAIAKEIVLAHGGTITAQSINEITTFTVSLPLAD